jgi:hypothetical protein
MATDVVATGAVAGRVVAVEAAAAAMGCAPTAKGVTLTIVWGATGPQALKSNMLRSRPGTAAARKFFQRSIINLLFL